MGKKEEDMLGVEDLFKVKARPVDFGVDSLSVGNMN